MVFFRIFWVHRGQNGGQWPPISNFLPDICRWPELDRLHEICQRFYLNFKDQTQPEQKFGVTTHQVSNCTPLKSPMNLKRFAIYFSIDFAIYFAI